MAPSLSSTSRRLRDPLINTDQTLLTSLQPGRTTRQIDSLPPLTFDSLSLSHHRYPPCSSTFKSPFFLLIFLLLSPDIIHHRHHIVDAVAVSTAPQVFYFDAADKNGVTLDLSFDLDSISVTPSNDAAASTSGSGAASSTSGVVFETELTMVVLDGSGASNDGAVVKGVTETRQFHGRWRHSGQADDRLRGTLIQNYEILNFAEIEDLKHSWEIVDER